MIQLIPDRAQWVPGEWVTGRMVFTLSRPVYFDALEARLEGYEFVKVRTRRHGKRHSSTTYTETCPFVDQPLALTHESGQPLDYGALDAGVHTYRFAALLERDVPPSLSKRAATLTVEVGYLLRASLSVPWRFDPNAVSPIGVWAPPCPPIRGPVASTQGPGFGTNLTSITGVLRQSEVPRGGALTGEFTLASEGNPHFRGLTVRLVERWAGTAKGHARADSRVVAERRFPGAPFGRPVPMSIPIPTDATPDYEGEICNLFHVVEAEADLSFAVNPTISIPVIIS